MRRILVLAALLGSTVLGVLYFEPVVANSLNTLGAHPAPAQVCDSSNVPCN